MHSDYYRGLAQVAAAQICEGLGFDAIQVRVATTPLALACVRVLRPYGVDFALCKRLEVSGCHGDKKSACDALADVMLRYMSEIGVSVHQSAELAGRTEGNLHDILAAFDELGTNMREVMEYATKAEEVPFARPLPRIPLQKTPRLPPSGLTWVCCTNCTKPNSFKDAKEEPPIHIPAFLPALPDQHTYKETPVYEGREIEPGKAKLEMHHTFRKAEKALISLQVGSYTFAPTNRSVIFNQRLLRRILHRGLIIRAGDITGRA
eukprot:3382023-Pyramimonas_sp.AAC.2